MKNTITTILFHILIVLIFGLFLHRLFLPSTASTEYIITTPESSAQAPHMSTVTQAKGQFTDMSPADFRVFNRLADQMNMYHSILRRTWDELYTGTAPGSRKPSSSSLISTGLNFCQHLKGHHDIEETYWFPILGRKMENFRDGGFAKEQHKAMHKGLDVLAKYMIDCKRGDVMLNRSEVRSIMDLFGGILWSHMDEEVKELGAHNMKLYWTKDEMQKFPF